MKLCRSQAAGSSWEVSRLCNISDDEKDVDWIPSETWVQEEPEPGRSANCAASKMMKKMLTGSPLRPGYKSPLKEGQAESVLLGLENIDCNDGEG